MTDSNDGIKKEDDSWIDDMYGYDEAAAAALVAQKQEAMAHARKFIKRNGKDAIELTDDSGNKINAPSQIYIKELEQKINRQIEILGTQSKQIEYLNKKFIEMRGELNSILEFLKVLGERY